MSRSKDNPVELVAQTLLDWTIRQRLPTRKAKLAAQEKAFLSRLARDLCETAVEGCRSGAYRKEDARFLFSRGISVMDVLADPADASFLHHLLGIETVSDQVKWSFRVHCCLLNYVDHRETALAAILAMPLERGDMSTRDVLVECILERSPDLMVSAETRDALVRRVLSGDYRAATKAGMLRLRDLARRVQS